MRLLGIAETHTRDGYLVVKPHVKNVLRTVYCNVVDSSGRKVGIVIDVVGRVDDPRVVVKLADRDLAEFYVKRKERLYYTTRRGGSRKS